MMPMKRLLAAVSFTAALLATGQRSRADAPLAFTRYHLHTRDGEVLGVLTDRAYDGQPTACRHGDPDLRERLYRTLARQPVVMVRSDGSMALRLGDQSEIPAREVRTLSSGARGGFWDSSTPGIETAIAVSPRGRSPSPRVDVTIMRQTPDGPCLERWIGLGRDD